MKPKLLCIVLLFMTKLLFSQDVVNIPDTNFKNYLLGEANINTNGDSEIQTSEASSYSGAIRCNGLGIQDMTGLEAFGAIYLIDCSNNNLTSLDVTNNRGITTLYCENNQIESLDFTGMFNLAYITCDANKLTELDVTPIKTTLIRLHANANELESFDISMCTKISTLEISDNPITNLNLKRGGLSDSLDNGISRVTALNVPLLNCMSVNNTTYVRNVWVRNNLIDSHVGISGDCSVSTVNIPDANLKAALINSSSINKNGDTEIQFTEAAQVSTLSISNKNISDLTGLSKFRALKNLICYGNNLTSIDVSGNTVLEKLTCFDNNLSSLDLSKNPKLESILAYNNQITSLNLADNEALETLNLNDNSLSTLNIDHLATLKKLIVNNNEIENLSTLNNILLYEVRANNNKISDLDLTQNTALRILDVSENNMSTLNVKNGNNTNVSTFNIVGNNLNCVTVDDANYSEANWSMRDAEVAFSVDCSATASVGGEDNITSVYPNPTTGIFIIQTSEPIKRVVLYNSLGQKLFESFSSELNISNQAKGIYFLQATTFSDKKLVTKIIKK